MTPTAYINRIATAVPPYDVHDTFVRYAHTLLQDPRHRTLFGRLANRAQIRHRWSCLPPSVSPEGPQLDADGFYRRGRFPTVAERMARYEANVVSLAARAVEGLGEGCDLDTVTHLVIVSCTGFFAPGLDLELVWRCGLATSVERTTVGFMGCQAALNALKLARHIIRSDPEARVLIVAVELCTLHLQETDDLEKVLSFLIFGDGCAAALVTAKAEGLALDRFHAIAEPRTGDLITWNIRDDGFSMFLSGRVPSAVAALLRKRTAEILSGASIDGIDHWAVHPGGRSVLDAVHGALGVGPNALDHSRRTLSDYGNMSSPTILFVLKRVLDSAGPGETGCAMSFGPGLSTESFLFRAVH
jgi:predicted naringenin-chalcone synthase